MLILDLTPDKSARRECEVWFADAPFRPKGYEKVTFKQARAEVADYAFPPRPFDTLVSDLLLTEEELWDRLSRGKRSDIHIAWNRDFSITCGNSAADIERLHLGQTSFAAAKAIGAPPDLTALLRNANHCLAAFGSDIAGDALCWVMYVLDRPIARAWFGGSDLARDKPDRGYANILLHWQMMLHLKSEGFETYDWGGAVLDPTSPLYSITRFKLGFGGRPERCFDYWCHFPPSRVTRVRRKLARGLMSLKVPREKTDRRET